MSRATLVSTFRLYGAVVVRSNLLAKWLREWVRVRVRVRVRAETSYEYLIR